MIESANRPSAAVRAEAMPESNERRSITSTNSRASGMTSAPAIPTAGDTSASPPLGATFASQPAQSYLSLRVSERKLVLALVDVLLINLALILALALLAEFALAADNLLGQAKWFITLTLVWLACATFFDCYSLARAASAINSARNALLAAILACLIYNLIPFVTPPLTSRGILFLFGGLTAVFVVTWRIAYARLFAQPWFQQHVLIVGAGTAGRALATAMNVAPHSDANPYHGTGYQIVGFVDDDPTLRGQLIGGMPVLGDNQDLVRLVQTLQINEMILSITNTQTISDEMMNALLRCREIGLRVSTMATVYERLTGRVPIDYVGRDLYMVLPMDDNAVERAYKIVKRLIDVVSALPGLAIVGMAIVPIAIANRLTSPGPLFYKQRRVGQGGKIFEIYKFRSMRPDAEVGTGAVWARQGDDRITPAGRILRKSRIDELPQFINVLIGDMSLIGPRPERPEFVNALSLMIPYYRARHAVKPGITGWAQVRFGYGNTHEDSRIKLEHDLYYVKHASLILDLLICLKTLPVMILRKGT